MAKEDERSRGQGSENVRLRKKYPIWNKKYDVKESKELFQSSIWRLVPDKSGYGGLRLKLRMRRIDDTRDLRFSASVLGSGAGDDFFFEGTFDLGKSPQRYRLGIYSGGPMWSVAPLDSQRFASVRERELGRETAKRLVHILPPIERLAYHGETKLGKSGWVQSTQWLQEVWDDPRTKSFDDDLKRIIQREETERKRKYGRLFGGIRR